MTKKEFTKRQILSAFRRSGTHNICPLEGLIATIMLKQQEEFMSSLLWLQNITANDRKYQKIAFPTPWHYQVPLR